MPRPNHPPTLMTHGGILSRMVINTAPNFRPDHPSISMPAFNFLMKFAPPQDHRLLQLRLLPPEPLQHQLQPSTLPVLNLSLQHRI